MKNVFKKNKYSISVIVILTAIVAGLSNCTKHDQVINPNVSPVILQDGILTSLVGTATLQAIGGTAWDGTIESVWNNAPKLTVHAVVPDPGNGAFPGGFIGTSTDIIMRSLYDANNIYLLIEWNCSQKNVKSAQWYYNPVTKRWAQEIGTPVIDKDGIITRPPFIQDQFVIMFDIANSTPAFAANSCYGACHVLPTPGAEAVMYTNGPTEKLDCWRARMLQVVNMNQANDTYIDWGGGLNNANQVHNDVQVNTTDGGGNNRQTIKITGTNTNVNVPVWMKISGSYSNSTILSSDTTNCVFVSAVDSNGIISYAAARGGTVTGTIDPRSTGPNGTDFQQVGKGDGPLCIPGSLVAPYTGSRGNVTANAYFTGTGWRLLLKRALNTNDVYKQDVDFSSLSDQSFGVGVMFNGADNQHAVAAGLKLVFKK
ncbi:MAG: ethylbenzene dehydrogenase-related protein [Bacteroidota bacterium]|nr:ethylbenzene dehydrogenase-related protein [Bacteroidota bacterium]